MDDAERRAELIEKVRDAIIDADEHDDSRCDDVVWYAEMAEAAVNVFAATLDEIHAHCVPVVRTEPEMSDTTNRFVLVDETGRVYDRTGVSVELSEQDVGLTLKVFVKPTTESAEANARHLARLSQSLNHYRHSERKQT